MKTYGIGDIHGCRIQFQKILAHIAMLEGDNEHVIVTTGDYVDRGPDSRGVLDILLQRPDIIALMGNHEQMLFDAAQGLFEDNYLANGGGQTLRSFGVTSARDVPSPYLDLISSRLRLFHEDEHRVFVHAGLKPGATAAETGPHHLLWIREPFLNFVGPHYKYVVHGHTPRRGAPDVHPNRVNLDTGCYSTGILCCAVFDSEAENPIKPSRFILANAE